MREMGAFLLLPAFASALFGTAGAGFFPATGAGFLAPFIRLVHGRPGAGLCFFLRYTALFISLFNMLSFPFLFACI
jgi:hypothetical protein